MNPEASIKKVLLQLEKHGIRSTKEFTKDLCKLVGSDIKCFVEVFYKDFIRKEFDDYNRFEKLKIDRKQKKRLKGIPLRRYEYRGTSNLRCIFVVCYDNDNDGPILLCAFNEDGDKKNGKNAYSKNIDHAIDIFEKVVGGWLWNWIMMNWIALLKKT